MTQKALRAFLAVAGVLLVAIAVAANSLGLDHNTDWGRGRIFLLVLGVTLTAAAWFFGAIARFVGRLPEARKIMERAAQSAPARLVRRASDFVSQPRPRLTIGLAAAAAVVVALIYVWFISAGLWTKWPNTTNYYSLLATAFRNGQISLQIPPSPALQALSNPYDINARQGVDYPWDAIYYNHRFYLYWGPAPALLPLLLGIFSSAEIGDQYLVFCFLSALFLANLYLLSKIWRRYFHDLPGWTLILGVLLIGLSGPLTWMLNRPEIYEAAIAAGQFFLIGGICLAYVGLERGKPLLLALAGLSWTLAIGSRTILVLAVACLATAICWALVIDKTASRGAVLSGLAALALPLLCGGLVLGWYNWARFGSVTEFGFKYTLTGFDLQQHGGQIFLPQYILPNLWNYLLNPFQVKPNFPFLRPLDGLSFAGYFAAAPQIYFSERITGILYTFPFLVFLLVPAAGLFARPGQNPANGTDPAEASPDLISPRRLLIALTLATLLTFGLLLGFFYATMRYWADVTPLLVLLSLIGFWQGYGFLAHRRQPVFRWFYALLGSGLALVSMGVSSLLAVSSYTERFKYLDPQLLEFLIEFFHKLRF